MTTKEKAETKDRIIEAASQLFSKFGFQGASVREIAHASDVNIAAINYHFGSKHNLYWATVNRKHQWLEDGIGEMAGRFEKTEDIVAEIFQFLLLDLDAVRTSLKMFLDDGVPEPDGKVADEMCNEEMGPPGTKYLIAVMAKEIGKTAPDEALLWGVKSIFGNILHWAMLCSSCKVEIIKAKHPEFSEKYIEKSLRHQTRATLEYIKNWTEF